MSSPLPIQHSAFSGPRFGNAKSSAAHSFAGTLRAFAERPQPVQKPGPIQSLGPLSSPIEEPKSKRPSVVGSPLTVGRLVASIEQSQPDASPLPSEAPEEKIEQPRPPASGLLTRAWSWLQKNNKFSAAKQLRLAETISLGEKRFVALIDIEGQKFLIGGGASGVSLLTQLGAVDASTDVLQPVIDAARQSK